MDTRQSDRQLRQHFRTDRFFLANGQWHFSTREQTIEGPFADRRQAQIALQRYVTAISCWVLEDTGRAAIGHLTMQA